jgi:hypothetical protein
MKDPRTRKERRADPARWYKIEGGRMLDEQGTFVNLPEGVCVYGSINDVIVITYPVDASTKDKMEMLKGTKEVIERAGVDRHVVVVPDSVGFLKLRPLSKQESAAIEKQLKAHDLEKMKKAGKTVH